LDALEPQRGINHGHQWLWIPAQGRDDIEVDATSYTII
jgi:hypothetical protein